MVPIGPGDLADWFGYEMNREPPPAHRLAPPSVPAERALPVLRDGGVEVLDVHPESGAVSFLASPRFESAPFTAQGQLTPDGSDLLIAACMAADDRRYLRDPVVEGFDAPPSPVTEMRSRMVGDDMAVIGPGGRMLLVDDRPGLRGELIVRTRTGETADSDWRAPGEIAGGLLERMPEDVELHAALGYFEASRRERQEWLRPVVMLVLDHTAVDEEDLSWRHVVVEPATHVADLRLDAGLELWFDPEGGFDGAVR